MCEQSTRFDQHKFEIVDTDVDEPRLAVGVVIVAHKAQALTNSFRVKKSMLGARSKAIARARPRRVTTVITGQSLSVFLSVLPVCLRCLLVCLPACLSASPFVLPVRLPSLSNYLQSPWNRFETRVGGRERGRGLGLNP